MLPATLPEPYTHALRGGPTLRWGVLAPGNIARSFATALHTHTDQRIVAVASRSAARAAAFAERFDVPRVHADYEALVGDPQVDVVYVAAPHSEHSRLALLAIAAGKHVLVEKPIAPTPAEAQRIVDAARAAGVFLMEAMWTRYLPQTSIVRTLLADGALGEIALVSADFGGSAPIDATSRMYDPALAGGGLLDVGVYPQSFISMVAGPPESIVVDGALAFTGVDATATVLGAHAGGIRSIASSTILAETAQHASIAGRDARIDVPTFWKPSGLTLSAGSTRLEWTDASGIVGGDGLAYEAAAFAHYVAEGRPESPLHPLDEVVATVATLDAARRILGVTIPEPSA